jgi:hypothetical protein
LISLLILISQDLRAVHLVVYFKNTFGLFSSMLKSNSSYINILHVGETKTIFSMMYLPLDLVSDYLEFGVFILYCEIDETDEIYASNLYKFYDEMIWETLCVKNIKKARIMNQGMVRFYD